MPENRIKDWAVARISLKEGNLLHENFHTFFTLKGGLKQFCAQTGEKIDESFDDYC